MPGKAGLGLREILGDVDPPVSPDLLDPGIVPRRGVEKLRPRITVIEFAGSYREVIQVARTGFAGKKLWISSTARSWRSPNSYVCSAPAPSPCWARGTCARCTAQPCGPYFGMGGTSRAITPRLLVPTPFRTRPSPGLSMSPLPLVWKFRFISLGSHECRICSTYSPMCFGPGLDAHE